jgi:hypothetical protein
VRRTHSAGGFWRRRPLRLMSAFLRGRRQGEVAAHCLGSRSPSSPSFNASILTHTHLGSFCGPLAGAVTSLRRQGPRETAGGAGRCRCLSLGGGRTAAATTAALLSVEDSLRWRQIKAAAEAAGRPAFA